MSQLVVRNVLLSSQDEVLLGLRADTLRWELPGGKVENETVLAAALREQMEETGITLTGTASLLGYVDSVNEKGHWADLIFLWRTWYGFARIMEDKQICWKWFAPTDLPEDSLLMRSTQVTLKTLLPGWKKTVCTATT